MFYLKEQLLFLEHLQTILVHSKLEIQLLGFKYKPGSTANITINVLVTNIPSINPISNFSSAQFEHVVDPSQPSALQTTISNTVSTTINSAILTTTKVLINLLFPSGIPLRIQRLYEYRKYTRYKCNFYKHHSS